MNWTVKAPTLGDCLKEASSRGLKFEADSHLSPCLRSWQLAPAFIQTHPFTSHIHTLLSRGKCTRDNDIIDCPHWPWAVASPTPSPPHSLWLARVTGSPGPRCQHEGEAVRAAQQWAGLCSLFFEIRGWEWVADFRRTCQGEQRVITDEGKVLAASEGQHTLTCDFYK